MALAGFVTAGTLPAAATASTVQYVALGDSYAAGVGAKSDVAQPVCGRSEHGYPELLDDEGRISLLDNVACIGATTFSVANTQVWELKALEKLNPGTRLVTLTVGANDLHFRTVLITCTQSPGNCKEAIDNEVTRNSLQVLGDNLTNLYAKIADAAPEARIVVTGYPILFEPGDPDHPSDFSPELVINPVNEAGARLNETIEDAVAAANDDGNIYYVDVTEEFAGHGVLKLINDPTATEPVDPSAFIHSPFICAPTTNPLCQNLAAAYHPTDKGYHAYANAISAALPRGWLNKQGLSA
jgi:lysophospholipase L1-like esterase